MELPGIFDEETVYDIVRYCVAAYKSQSTDGERFSRLFTQEDVDGAAVFFRSRSLTALDGSINNLQAV